MEINFDKILNKKEVLDIMQCYENSINYNKYCRVYDEVANQSIKHLTPKGYYIIKENSNYIDIDCEKIIFCIVTLGSHVDEEIKRYFDNNDILKSMMLNSIADQMLYDISNSMFRLLQKEQSIQGVNLTSRIEPGSSESNIEFQKDILDVINNDESTGITLTTGYMFSPTKTLSYYYGASKNLPKNTVDHDCNKCSNLTCPYRKVNVTIIKGSKSFLYQVKKNENLLNVIRQNNLPIQAYCGGKRSCGKCKVRLVEGDLILSNEEKKLLTQTEIDNRIILACFHEVTNDIVISLDMEDNNSKIQTDYYIDCNANPKYRLININKIVESADNNYSVTELINNKLRLNLDYSLNSIKKLSRIDDLNDDIFLLTRNDRKVLHASNKSIDAYGIAVDIGTTTIVVTLIDLLNTQEIGIYKNVNPQNSYGADIISRINYAMKDTKAIQTKLICKEITLAIRTIATENNINANDIVEIVISGNTTMMYLLEGINPKRLSVSPFTTIDLSLREYNYNELFSDDYLNCQISLLPGISAFIGSDIIAGLSYCNILEQKGNVLFIDIGTNGEIALKINDRIICTSTAAGPAFEGSNIKCGMSSMNGAISNIKLEDNCVNYEVIGNCTPKGLCGSALIDITSELLKNDIIDKTGKLRDNKYTIYNNHDIDISLYQDDIRQLQLAKAAISAGINVMLDISKVSYSDIDTVYLSGGFGSNLNIESAITIGLIPKDLKNKIEILGNTSLGGCVKYLLEHNNSNNFDNIKSKCSYLELSTNTKFNNEYISNIHFNQY